MRDYIRERLVTIKAATQGADAIEAPGYWVGDKAGERRVLDDLKSGRLAWRKAHHLAQLGLEALDRGDRELAELARRQAESLAAGAEEARPKKKNRAALTTSAKRRGRPPHTQDRN